MRKLQNDITGKKYNRLLVLNYTNERSKGGHSVIWKCKCDCGKIIKVAYTHIINNNVKSCGCYKIDRLKSRAKHRMGNNSFYRVWLGMNRRCNSKNCTAYKDYGERGIKICSEWSDFLNFKKDMYQNYLEHKKEYGKLNTTLERINNKR